MRFKSRKCLSRRNTLAAIISLMDKVNCLLKVGPTLTYHPAIKVKLSKVRLSDRLTDL